LRQILALTLFCAPLAAQTNSPERQVAGNVITSQHDPNARIELPTSVRYVGADRWPLYDIADCELHAFVEADAQKNVQRLYWVQFEGYLPSQPTLKHDYDSSRHTSLSGVDFYLDTWVRVRDARTQKGSDREHVEALIRAKGYTMPAGLMYVRLVRLLDQEKRKELMIIYGEDLAPAGYTAADLSEGGKSFNQWPGIEKGLLERAKQKVALGSASLASP